MKDYQAAEITQFPEAAPAQTSREARVGTAALR
jgi:hypothetical protein